MNRSLCISMCRHPRGMFGKICFYIYLGDTVVQSCYAIFHKCNLACGMEYVNKIRNWDVEHLFHDSKDILYVHGYLYWISNTFALAGLSLEPSYVKPKMLSLIKMFLIFVMLEGTKEMKSAVIKVITFLCFVDEWMEHSFITCMIIFAILG